jgi:hypothetical protein
MPVPPIIHAERRVAHTLRDAGAADAASARQLFDLNGLEERALERLIGAGAIVREGPDRYFLNPAAWTAYRARRGKRVLTALALVLVVAGVLLFLGMVRTG